MKSFLGFNSVLCLSPHPDDVEYSMSGTICQSPQTIFHVLTLTQGTDCDPSSGPNRLLEVETFWKTAQVHNVKLHRNKVPMQLPFLIQFIEALNLEYDAILLTPNQDSHFEHRLTHELAWALARHRPLSIIEYKTSSTLPSWIPNYFVPLTLQQVDNKIECIRSSFISQLDGQYFDSSVLKAFHQDFFLLKRGIEWVENFHIKVLYGLH